MTSTLELELALELHYGAKDLEGLSHVRSDYWQESRWSQVHRVIIVDSDGQHWRYDIELPATEHAGYVEDYNPEELQLIAVVPEQVVVTKWKDME